MPSSGAIIPEPYRGAASQLSLPEPELEPEPEPQPEPEPEPREPEEQRAMRQAAVVIHTGSLNTVVGFAGEEAPRAAFASVVGQPRHPGVMQGAVGNRQDSFDRSCVGERARRLAGIFLVKHPVMHGIVTDWAGAEKLWAHALYTELRLERGEHPVLLTEQALNPKANHERMVAVLFEALDVPAACVATEQVLSLAAAGHSTGLHADCKPL
jgi:actin